MYVYLITNNINDKWYIGKHCQPPASTAAKKYYGSGKLIKLAIDKYGIENFTKVIIEECSSREQLAVRELYFINLFMKYDQSGFSYNIQTKYYIGREKGFMQTAAHIKKRIDARRSANNFKWSNEMKLAASKRMKGQPARNKGMKCANISKSKLGAKNPMARKVILIETGQVFDTMCQAAKETGYSYNSISLKLWRHSKNSLFKYA